MKHDFFLPKKILPETFVYPETYINFVNSDFPDMEPWHFHYNDLEFHFHGLKERYSNRVLVPFARRRDNDDVACFDASTHSENPPVIIIHDWASPGWENHGICKDFLAWVELAKQEAIEWENYWKNYKTRMEALSKTLSHALRHAPWLYELELDEQGWVPIEELLSALRADREEWANLQVSDIQDLIHASSKKRHELKNGKIRALYGHSTPEKLLKTPSKPPAVLYHGTSPEIVEAILKDGLKPMGRHYIHLSTDIDTARQVGRRKATKPTILIIEAQEAYNAGIAFYLGNEHVWLADNIPAKFIVVCGLKK